MIWRRSKTICLAKDGRNCGATAKFLSASYWTVGTGKQNLPVPGIREMCSWERFCTFAREPERRKVGSDARISIDGAAYEVDPDLAGEFVILWWGLFDHELYIESLLSR